MTFIFDGKINKLIQSFPDVAKSSVRANDKEKEVNNKEIEINFFIYLSLSCLNFLA